MLIRWNKEIQLKSLQSSPLPWALFKPPSTPFSSLDHHAPSTTVLLHLLSLLSASTSFPQPQDDGSADDEGSQAVTWYERDKNCLQQLELESRGVGSGIQSPSTQALITYLPFKPVSKLRDELCCQELEELQSPFSSQQTSQCQNLNPGLSGGMR